MATSPLQRIWRKVSWATGFRLHHFSECGLDKDFHYSPRTINCIRKYNLATKNLKDALLCDYKHFRSQYYTAMCYKQEEESE